MTEIYRYERKFLVSGSERPGIEQAVRLHPAKFTEIFEQRQVNNIYFDTPGLNYFYDNQEGEKNRKKIRIRWYGWLFGQVSDPVLEYKVKSGLLGTKHSYCLSPFMLDAGFGKGQLKSALQHPGVPQSVKNELLMHQPTLLNQYTRKYYLSADQNFRVTIDSHLVYYKIAYSGNTFLQKIKDPDTVVVELKYAPAFDDEARNISTYFPFPLTKSSKYLMGLEHFFI